MLRVAEPAYLWQGQPEPLDTSLTEFSVGGSREASKRSKMKGLCLASTLPKDNSEYTSKR